MDNQLNQSIYDDDGSTSTSTQLRKSSLKSSIYNLDVDDSVCSSLSLDASQSSTNKNEKNEAIHCEAAKTDVFDVENTSLREVSLSARNSEREHDVLDDSESMAALSPLTLTDGTKSSPSKTYQRASTASNVFDFENNYECNLRTYATICNEKLRPPLQTSIDWINSMCKSTSMNSVSKETCASGIIRSNEIKPRSKRSPSEYLSNILTTTKQKTLAM